MSTYIQILVTLTSPRQEAPSVSLFDLFLRLSTFMRSILFLMPSCVFLLHFLGCFPFSRLSLHFEMSSFFGCPHLLGCLHFQVVFISEVISLFEVIFIFEFVFSFEGSFLRLSLFFRSCLFYLFHLQFPE